jgi:hypothetical protein
LETRCKERKENGKEKGQVGTKEMGKLKRGYIFKYIVIWNGQVTAPIKHSIWSTSDPST